MNAYENMIDIIRNLPKNHYKSLRLQHKVNEHISGLRITAKKMAQTSLGKICNQEANRYQRLLNSATNKEKQYETLGSIT